MSQMTLQLKQGLAVFGYSDHYAILGLEVDASAAAIRKRYVQLARLLHPDSCAKSENKEQASQILSKLVNPTYQILSQEKERTDYNTLLRLVGQRAVLEVKPDKLQSQLARELFKAPEFEVFYHDALQDLAQRQYLQLDRSVTFIEQLSELNLVYLLRRETQKTQQASKVSFAEPEKPVPAPPASNPEVAVTVNAKEPVEKTTASGSDDFVKQYIRRAEEFIAKNLYPSAMQEIRDALRLNPQSSRCNSLMGIVYLKQKQPKMAKEYLAKALKFDPNNAEAKQGMAEVQKQEAQAAKAAPASAKPPQGTVKPTERRGLFGLFGSKK
ncbi:MAG: J domain-containing protein [Thermosynechococcaceae cyanobacterium]